MSLENSMVVDATGLEYATGTVVLTIIDSWDWSEERKHLLALQEKLNSYFEFVTSRQVYELYPDAVGHPLRVDIISRYQLSPAAEKLLDIARGAALELGVTITQRVYTGSESIHYISISEEK